MSAARQQAVPTGLNERATATRVSVIGSLPPVKGISAYTAHLLRALANDPSLDVQFVGFRRIYPRFAYPGGHPDESELAAPVLMGVDARNLITWSNPLTWLRAGFALRGDVVHAQWWSYILAPVYATVLGIARLRGKRVVMTVHNVSPHEDGPAKRLLNRAVFRFAHQYIVHSEQQREALVRATGAADARISVLPHGVLDTPRTSMTKSQARARLGIADDANVALAFGNIREYKGLDVLLRSFARVAAADEKALLVIAGEPWVDFEPYRRLIDELGIGRRVKLHLQYVPTAEVEAYFAACDVVALPYARFEAQTGVGTRALPFGRPLVVTDTGGLPDLVLDPAAVVPPNDDVALAAALSRVLGDRTVRDRMSVDSLTIAATLDWDAIAVRTAGLYDAMLAQPAAEMQVEVEQEPAPEPAGVRRS